MIDDRLRRRQNNHSYAKALIRQSRESRSSGIFDNSRKFDKSFTGTHRAIASENKASSLRSRMTMLRFLSQFREESTSGKFAFDLLKYISHGYPGYALIESRTLPL